MAPRSKRGRPKSEPVEEQKKPKKGLSVGDECPDFELETEQSTPDEKKTVKVKDVAQESGVVLFFYPRANTPGCTAQACGFRDNYEKYVEAGYKVFGVSADKPRSQLNWKKKNTFQFNLLSDPSYEFMSAMGVAKAGKKINRSHIIIAKGGKIKEMQIGITPKFSIAEAMKSVSAPEEPQEPEPEPEAGDGEKDEGEEKDDKDDEEGGEEEKGDEGDEKEGDEAKAKKVEKEGEVVDEKVEEHVDETADQEMDEPAKDDGKEGEGDEKDVEEVD